MKQFERHKARKLALQAIYQWQYTYHPTSELTQQHLETANPKKVDIAYCAELINSTIHNISIIDQQLALCLDRDIDLLNPVVRAALRLSTYELIYRLDTPYKVIINEALEITKTFGSEDGYKYVNGVLDKMAKQIRANEVKPHPSKPTTINTPVLQ